MRLVRKIKLVGGSTRLVPLPTGVFRAVERIVIDYSYSRDSGFLSINCKAGNGDGSRPLYKIGTNNEVNMVPLPSKSWFNKRKHLDPFHLVDIIVIDVDLIKNDSLCKLRIRPATSTETIKATVNKDKLVVFPGA